MIRTERLALVGTGGVASLAVILVAMHAIQPDLSPLSHYVSEYAHGQFGWLVMVGYVAAGVGTFVLAWRLIASLGTTRWALASAVCLTVGGAGLIATGLTRIDVPLSDGLVISTPAGTAHELAGYVAALGLIPGAFILSGAFRRDSRLQSAVVGARLFGWAILATFVGVILSQSFDLIGLGQRIFIGAWLAWLIYIGLQLGRVSMSDQPRRADA